MAALLPLPSGPDMVRQLRAVLALMRFDAQALAAFDLSVDGFWRSFGLALLIVPAGLFLEVATEMLHPRLTAGPDGTPMLILFLVEALRASILWFGFPLALIPLVRSFQAGAGYGAFVVTWNWSKLVIDLAFLPIRLIVLATGEVSGLVATLMIALFLFSVVYCWYLAATTLRGGALLSTVVVLLSLVMDLGLFLLADEMVRPPSLPI